MVGIVPAFYYVDHRAPFGEPPRRDRNISSAARRACPAPRWPVHPGIAAEACVPSSTLMPGIAPVCSMIFTSGVPSAAFCQMVLVIEDHPGDIPASWPRWSGKQHFRDSRGGFPLSTTTLMSSKRFLIVPEDSSAASRPLPGLTIATATLVEIGEIHRCLLRKYWFFFVSQNRPFSGNSQGKRRKSVKENLPEPARNLPKKTHAWPRGRVAAG